jgi:hypothetical protein
MHYYALVKVASREDLTPQVERAMRPFREEYHEDSGQLTGFWDWWSIGGRYTGRIDGYDPTTDRRNMEVCWLCRGTGKRTDDVGNQYREEHPEYGCNGCDSTGIKIKFPSDWAPHSGDIALRSDIPDASKPYTLIADGRATHREEWDGEHFTNNQAAMDEAWDALAPDSLLVVVDYHD